ncbi:MAG: hypothetical protein GXN92_02675 [Candidatus Micrarchaeota archaeon]|nr:hypothetical protein [Candidatus Micrarchaeota archaeon]
MCLFYQHAEALIRGIGNNPKIHAQLPDVIENAQKAGIKRLYITHYGKQITLPPNPGFEEFRALQENEIIKL